MPSDIIMMVMGFGDADAAGLATLAYALRLVTVGAWPILGVAKPGGCYQNHSEASVR